MQSSLPSLQKVTAALAAQQGAELYVADAARLGFRPGEPPPRYLDTDLGSGSTFWFNAFDGEGAALYRQVRGRRRLSLRVLNARIGGDIASAEGALVASLLTELTRMVEQAGAVRAGFSVQASKEDIAHLLQGLKAGLTDSLRFLYCGTHAKAALDLIAEASDREANVRLAVRRFESWLESWTPETSASPVTTLHHSIEFEAVKEIASLLRRSIEPSKAGESTKRMPTGMKVRTEVCPGCQTGHSGPPCPTEQKQATRATAHRLRASEVEISTTQYQFAHGHLPKGRANWAFLLADDPETPWWAPASLMYAEACRKARAEAKRRGVMRVSVAT